MLFTKRRGELTVAAYFEETFKDISFRYLFPKSGKISALGEYAVRLPISGRGVMSLRLW
jgi:hypothetical protein